MKITKSLEDILTLNEALVRILKLAGIPYQKVYVLDELRKSIRPILEEWTEKSIEIFNKYAMLVPEEEFILPNRYKDFKEEMLKAKVERIPEIFKNYESKSDTPGEAIPQQKINLYRKEINLAAKNTPPKEIEYEQIELDNNLINVLRQLPGELQASLSFVLKNRSNLEVFRPRLQ